MDKGFAPILTGHEPVMLLLHKSTINKYKFIIYINIINIYIYIYNILLYIAPMGFEPMYVIVKILYLNLLTMEPN